MNLSVIDLPPGVSRKGTRDQEKGRWRDSDLVRFSEGNVGPVGGWTARTTSAMTGKARAMLLSRSYATGGPRTIVIVTHSKVYALTPSAVAPVDITPVGFATGRADATTGGGYGVGTYGTGLYGTPRIDNVNVQDATMATIDLFGQYPVICSPDDGKIYEWQLDISTPTKAAQVTNAPTNCVACAVTAEGHLVALLDNRTVKWSHQGTNTNWTAGATSQAGSYLIQSQARLMCAKRVRGGLLIFTENDVHLMQYVGSPFWFRIDRVGDNCGIISRGAVAVSDARAAWMGPAGFYTWDGGGVQPIPCEVYEYVFGDINMVQRSKFWAVTNAQENEIEFHYCSAASTEIDRCVVLNYLEGHWTIRPSVARLCGAERGGVFVNPIKATSDGYLYDFETGYSWGGATPFLESGPIELGAGDRGMRVRRAIFDEKTVGDVNVSFKTRDWPGDSETTYGPYSAPNPIALHFSGRQVRVRVELGEAAASRIGPMRLGMVPSGRRVAA